MTRRQLLVKLVGVVLWIAWLWPSKEPKPVVPKKQPDVYYGPGVIVIPAGALREGDLLEVQVQGSYSTMHSPYREPESKP